jgi:hypothetical protein
LLAPQLQLCLRKAVLQHCFTYGAELHGLIYVVVRYSLNKLQRLFTHGSVVVVV